jgi:hypothetical protein
MHHAYHADFADQIEGLIQHDGFGIERVAGIYSLSLLNALVHCSVVVGNAKSKTPPFKASR